ncbi:hypothetical protein HHI36_001624 [Cryptolaemus montrouzieri]|uniref:Tyr recombinase domain-containing protein n=1 Tax=Cryptolaemus montrouzieri TaxID=559131 RepID=A0ABD2P8C3_9CUCU
MIRSKLRCVAKFYITLKEIVPHITKLEQCFDPEYYDDVIKAINVMCTLNEQTGCYKTPATAFAIGSYLKKISFYLVTEYIKRKDDVGQKNIKDFLHLLQEGLSHDIYKTVEENQLEQKRKRKIDLPNSEDIHCLSDYLEKQRIIYTKKLKSTFSVQVFKELMSILLVSLQIFNRRRAGEMERIKIDDFLKYEALEETDEMLENISEEEKRMEEIMGKLGRGVPVMIRKDNLESINLILEFREQMGVASTNPYLFGVPGSKTYSHLSATQLMNKYSNLCGAIKPETLRGTKLRKHFATKCATMNLGNTEIKDIADYMGHDERIHVDHYRLPNATKDIMRISNILETASGNKGENFGETSILNVSDSRSPDSRRNSTRLSWSQEEISLMEQKFLFHLENFENPSYDVCQEVINNSHILNHRKPEHLKAFISNQIQKGKQAPNTR